MKLLGPCSVVVAVLLCACSSQPTAPTPAPPPQPIPAPPTLTITCPQSVTVTASEGTTATVSFGQATAAGGLQPIQVSCTRQSGSMFEAGTTPVQCTASDAAGQSTSCLFNVTVNVVIPQLAKTKYLAFGDSLTAGEIALPTGGGPGGNFRFIVEPALAYPAKLQAALRARYTTQASSIDVVNGGWPGEWAQDGSKRLEQLLPTIRPEVLIVMEGLNDISALEQGVGLAANAIDRMAKFARGRGASVIIATVPPSRPPGGRAVSDKLIQELNALIRGVAAGEGAVLVDLYAGMSKDIARYISADGLHPTEAGYERMAELVLLAIRANYEIKAP